MAQESLSSLVQTWLDWDKDPSSRAEIEQLRDAKNEAELELRLRNRIEFGTAGLRGRMAAGFSCMNALTVIQASQGLAKYIHSKGSEFASKGVVIGHDARHNSPKFAGLATNAFIALKIPVWCFTEPSPTPTVPFGINYYKAAGGIMVTASHNPPQDNGYKVYSSNGAQINRPEDEEIAQSIRENLEPWPSAWQKLQTGETGEYVHDTAYQQLVSPYTSRVKEYTLSTVSEWRPFIPFVYTPLHGVGGLLLPYFCTSELGVESFVSVPRQIAPNPEFPTVKFPNPEEAGALDLAIQSADQKGRTLIIANDPDADRFAAAEKVDGEWFLFTGNHVGVLLASHVLDSLENKDIAKQTLLTTTVSSGMIQKMAESRGAQFKETLTGFKWMGNIARDLEAAGKNVPFAYEEALGYMFPSVCYDKDGITAACVFLAATAKWKAQGMTAYAKLQQLFTQFGHHETLNNYFRSPNPALTTELFRGIRSGSFLSDMKLGSMKILRWRDLTEGYDSGTADNKPDLPEDPSSQMLTLWLEGGVRFTFRGSGTEPKVKFYIECCGGSRDDAVKAVCGTFLAILNEWVKQYTPSMTHSDQLSTSSGHVLNIN